MKEPNDYIVCDGFTLIELTQDQYAIIDTEDLDLVLQFRWSADWHKVGQKYYAKARIIKNDKSTTIGMHVLLMEPNINEEVDHIDGDGLNNRRYNLRNVTHIVNTTNRPRLNINSRTGVRGVAYDTTRDRYSVWVMHKGVSYYGGVFPHTPEGLTVAESAAIELRKKLHKEG